MKERIEFELLADELSAESNKVLLKTHLFMDHKTASGEDGGGLEIPVIFDLIGVTLVVGILFGKMVSRINLVTLKLVMFYPLIAITYF